MPTPITKRTTPDVVPVGSGLEVAPEQAATPEVHQEVAPETAKEDGANQEQAGPGNAAEMQHLAALRQGPLAQVAVPSVPVSQKSLEEIKKLLFPTIDIEKATPQELVNYLLINHNLDTAQAHDWIQFLAENEAAGR